MLLNLIAGHDERDTTSENMPKKDYTKALKNDVKGLKIGIPKQYYGEGINPEVKAKLEEAIETYKKLGAEVEEFSLDIADYALATYYIIACAEASSNLGRFDGIRYGYRVEDPKDMEDLYLETRKNGFGQEVKRRIMVGSYLLSGENAKTYYNKALSIRDDIKKEFDRVFNS